MSNGKYGPRMGRDHWERVIEAFGKSGQSQREYCETRGIRYPAFRNWLHRLRHEVAARPGRKRDKGQFVQVVPATPAPGVLCKVRVGSAEVFFSELPPALYLGDMLRAMDR